MGKLVSAGAYEGPLKGVILTAAAPVGPKAKAHASAQHATAVRDGVARPRVSPLSVCGRALPIGPPRERTRALGAHADACWRHSREVRASRFLKDFISEMFSLPLLYW